MKILDEYVIILNMLLFILLLYNFFKKFKIIEGHEDHSSYSEEISNHEKGKALNRDGDSLINEVSEANKDAEVSSSEAKKSNDNTDWKKHNKKAKENEEKVKDLKG